MYNTIDRNSFSLAKIRMGMKIIKANPEIPSMTLEEAEGFLKSKLNLYFSTIDDTGDPNIQPVWFYYDEDKKIISIVTGKTSKKTQNVQKRSNIYFCVEDANIPYKGVKGKGIAKISEDPKVIIPTTKRISLKYLGSLEHPVAQSMTERSKSVEGVIIEINPKFFSTGDFGKMQ
ncbi:MAG: pyridoxamine 5'-phosphate oxidase family protein [Candidatus Nitrosocosmicus sp.]